MKPIVLTAALGVALAPIAQSQLVPSSDPWPAALGAGGTFHGSEIGYIIPNGDLDLVVERGGSIVVCSAIGIHSSFYEVASSAISFDVVFRGSPFGADAVAIVDGQGLTLHWLNAAGDAFDSVALGSNAWNGAARIRSGDADGLYGSDIVGLAADHRTFLSCLSTTSAGGTSFVDGPSTVVPNDVSDFVLIQWDADAELEVAMLTTAGLEIREPDGTLITSVTAYPTGGRLVAIDVEGTAQQKVAWVTLHPNAVNELLIVGNASGFEAAQMLAPLQTVGLEAADIDGDGNGDLIFTGKTGYYALIAFQQAGSPSFGFGPSMFIIVDLVADPGSAAPNLEAEPAAADIDGDGDVDVVCAIDRPDPGVDVVSRVANTVIDAEVYRPLLPPSFTYAFEGEEVIGQADLSIVLPSPTAPANEVPAAATHVDVVVWRSEGDGENPGRVAVQHDTIDLSAPEGQFPLTLNVVIDEPQWPFDAIYAIEIRYVERDGAGELLQAFPARIGIFTADSVLLDEWHLNPEVSVYSAIIPDDSSGGGSGGGGSGGGGSGGGSQQQEQQQGGGDPPHSSVEAGGFIETPLIPSFPINEIEDPDEPDLPPAGS